MPSSQIRMTQSDTLSDTIRLKKDPEWKDRGCYQDQKVSSTVTGKMLEEGKQTTYCMQDLQCSEGNRNVTVTCSVNLSKKHSADWLSIVLEVTEVTENGRPTLDVNGTNQ